MVLNHAELRYKSRKTGFQDIAEGACKGSLNPFPHMLGKKQKILPVVFRQDESGNVLIRQAGVVGILNRISDLDIRTSCIAFMLVFNPELILHNINSWPQGIMIFIMSLIGMSSFECFAQGWCLTKNKLYEIPFFLAAWFTLFHPGGVASFFHVDLSMKYYFYPL